jgi:PEP-CTERM motif
VSLGFQQVPEPASLVLVLTAVGLLGFMTRRRREVQAA